MIKSLHIKNLHGHKDTKLDFHEGVNVIVGSSDSGKSDIVRALVWVIQNKPSGDSLRRHRSKQTDVTVITSENKGVSRYKSKSVNEYELDGETFKAIGKSGVPEKVTKVLNILPINIQTQFDSPFLLSDTISPGEVARTLNQVANLNVIDESMSRIEQRRLATNRKLDEGKEERKELAGKLKQYSDIDELEEKVTRLEKIEEELREKKAAINNLDQCIHTFERIEDDLSDISHVLQHKEKVSSLLKKASRREAKALDSGNLSKAIQDLIKCEGDLQWLYDTSAESRREFADLMPDTCPLCGRGCDCEKKKKRRRR